MADVLDILTPAAAPAGGRAYDRIRWTSRILAWLFAGLAVAFAAFTVGLVLAAVVSPAPGLVLIGPRSALISFDGRAPPGFVAFQSLGLAHQAAYVAVALIRAAPALAIFWSLRRLFRAYAAGVVFTRDNAVLIRWVGLWLAADAIAPFGCHLFLTAAGWEIDRNWAHFTSLQELVLGGVVAVVALVMEAGREIEEERGLFV